jgi:hypothetical protein
MKTTALRENKVNQTSNPTLGLRKTTHQKRNAKPPLSTARVVKKQISK